MENGINFTRSFIDLNYFTKIAVITFMNREMIHLLATYENLNDAQIKSMSIQELFDLRHEMLALRDKLGVLLREWFFWMPFLLIKFIRNKESRILIEYFGMENLIIQSFMHSLIHSFTHSLIESFMHSFIVAL